MAIERKWYIVLYIFNHIFGVHPFPYLHRYLKLIYNPFWQHKHVKRSFVTHIHTLRFYINKINYCGILNLIKLLLLILKYYSQSQSNCSVLNKKILIVFVANLQFFLQIFKLEDNKDVMQESYFWSVHIFCTAVYFLWAVM